MTNKPFIHLFKTRKDCYFYDVNTNRIVKIEENAYKELSRVVNDPESSIEELVKRNSLIKRLVARGFLSSNRVSKIVHPENDTLEYSLQNKVNLLILQITQNCNLRCSYCTYSGEYENRGHSNRKMDFSVAQKAIDFLIDNSRDAYSISIGFYGGEPLLEFPFIKKCAEYARKKTDGKKLKFTMTTNGTIMTDKIAKFLVENDVSILISLDGPQEVHDENRRFAETGKGTFSKIMENIEFLLGIYPDIVKKNVAFNAVMDRRFNFNCFNDFFLDYETIKDMRINFFNISDNYLDEQNVVSEKYVMDWNYNYFKFFLYKLGKVSAEDTCDLYNNSLHDLKKRFVDRRYLTKNLPAEAHHGGPCTPGVQRTFIDVDGNIYPCERVSETSEVMRIGHVDRGFDIERVRALLNVGQLTKEECKNCWAIRFCHLCAVAADNLTSLSGEKKLTSCESVRYSVEQSLQDYCLYKEFNFDFEMDEVV